ncbi:hypothetical protein DH2020_019819 [Rehmannia glutinosa]|uniref:DUF4283 domain-containing protein n=1 Tax=Rehmannia glutinosa TaxID=99300 RepID=A0ABR0WII7_REHGL
MDNQLLNHETIPTSFGTVIHQEDKEIFTFSDVETHKLAEKWNFTLVGKFSQGIPEVKYIRKLLDSLKLKGTVNIHILNIKHVLLIFSHEEDFSKLWLHPLWHIESFIMRMFRWSPRFSVHRESSIVLVWIKLPGLPIHLYDKRALLSIAKLIGQPIQIFKKTALQAKLLVALICVGLDITKPPKDCVLLCINSEIRSQKVVYESSPKYCIRCYHLGHTVDSCYIIGNALRPVKQVQEASLPQDLPDPEVSKPSTNDTSIPEHTINHSETISQVNVSQINVPSKDIISPITTHENQFAFLQVDTENLEVPPPKSSSPPKSGPSHNSGASPVSGSSHNCGSHPVSIHPESGIISMSKAPHPDSPSSSKQPLEDSLVNVLCKLDLELAESQAKKTNGFTQKWGGDILVERDHDQLLYVQLSSALFPCNLYASFVYAKCTRRDRRPLWDELRDISAFLEDNPWVVGGDFNCFVFDSVRTGSDTNRSLDMAEFSELISNCGFIDPGCTGVSLHTWVRNGLFERPDRFLLSPDWHGTFPKSSVTHLSRVWSDHAPLLLQASLSITKPIALFRHVFGDIFANLNAVEFVVHTAKMNCDASPTPTHLVALRKATAKLTLATKIEGDFWHQKSSCK